MTKECAEIVNEKTVCIYLRASVDTLVSHLENESEGRPMLAGGDIRYRVTELMNLRASTYENTAHIIIDTDGKSVEDICIEIDLRPFASSDWEESGELYMTDYFYANFIRYEDGSVWKDEFGSFGLK